MFSDRSFTNEHFSLTLSIPQPRLDIAADGSVVVEVDGLDAPRRHAGAPDVPTRTVLVAIPPDARPTLVVGDGDDRVWRGIVPAPVPRRVVEIDEARRREVERRGPLERQPLLDDAVREIRVRDRSIYDGAEPFPRSVAWFGNTGWLRDQRYVELHLAPVRYDPTIGGLRSRDTLTIDVRFNSPSGAALDPAPADPRFEPVYRASFVNYEQSRQFRRRSPDSRDVAVAAAASLGETGPRQRIRVDQDAVVRLDYPALQPTGLLAHDVGSWVLTHRGVAVPMQVQDDGDGVIEPGEWIQFYGERLDDEPKTVLNTDFPILDLFEARDFTDVNTYFLFVGTAGESSMTTRDAAPTLTRTPPTQFTERVHEEIDDSYRPLGAADPWYWLPTLTLSARSRVDTIELPGLVSGSEPVTARARMRGIDEDLDLGPDHPVRLSLLDAADTVLATTDDAFDDRTIFDQELDWTWPGGGPQASDPVKVELEVLDGPAVCSGSPCNSVILDWIEIDYQRAFSAVGDRLSFDWPDGDAEFVVGGLNDPSPEIFEITSAGGESPTQPVRLLGGQVSGSGPFAVRFRVDQDPLVPDGTPRRFVVFGDGAVVAPADFTPDVVSDLRDQALQADLIVIAHPDVLDAAPSSPLALLLAHRATAAGGGLSSKVVLLGDVEDEFNHGLPGPTAVHEFLRWVMSTEPGEGWSDPRPSYVMLLGDASFDYKAGTAAGNFVPTQILFKDDPVLGLYASDNVMSAVVGDDQLTDFMIGRIPAQSVDEANRMLLKVLDYEQNPPLGGWRNHTLFISDRGKAPAIQSEGAQFELINSQSRAYMDEPPYTAHELRYLTDYFNTNDPNPWDTINGDLKDTINGVGGGPGGTSLVQFFGHGNFVLWSTDFFFDERINPPSDTFQDSMDLVNSTRLPWLMAHNCLTGGFHASNSIGENWFKLDGGGSVAVFAPTGLSFNFVGGPTAFSIFDDVFGPAKARRLGPIVAKAVAGLCANGSIEACQNYALQGDPATRLVLRDVGPAGALGAAASNQRVDLAWDASPTPGVTYDLYRTDDLIRGTYARIGTALTQTTHADTAVINATTYYYYVVAVDGEGFESAWSNFNSDCATAGVDCVQATPLNPDPPLPPSDVTLVDPGTGETLRVSWAPNPENDLAYYEVHYGIESGVYTETTRAGLVTELTLTGLVEGQMYHFVVTATNTSDLTSDPSDEASDFPVFSPGLDVPAYVDDLRVGRQGDDLVLEWTEVTTDVYGKPVDVVKFEILRGPSPDYATASLTKIGECVTPCSSFTDIGAAITPSDYHYRVRAADGEGNLSGLGGNPPDSTTLLIGKDTEVPGKLVLTWSPVATTVDGSPVEVVHYLLYAADQPFSRADVRDGLLPAPTIVTTTSFELTPPMQNRYYSVLAVDGRGNVSPF
ncbi:MAG TPA: C25 family cysteine peptidase [Candidatus Polarisedimenticolaceae bacterium]|nr:C25 family cysteine peptidase [Candidatus Polarisedimenticolaceae bacterium]